MEESKSDPKKSNLTELVLERKSKAIEKNIALKAAFTAFNLGMKNICPETLYREYEFNGDNIQIIYCREYEDAFRRRSEINSIRVRPITDPIESEDYVIIRLIDKQMPVFQARITSPEYEDLYEFNPEKRPEQQRIISYRDGGWTDKELEKAFRDAYNRARLR